MFQHILVPLDFTRRNAAAVRLAADLAGEEATVTLLHVVERIEGIPQAELRGFYRRAAAVARKKLHALAARLGRDGPAVREVVFVGHRVAGILKYAEENAVDLMVLCSHQVDLRRPGSGFGTISYQVGILSRCPALLVK